MKRIIACAAAFLMIMGAASCSGTGKSNTPNSTGASATTAAAAKASVTTASVKASATTAAAAAEAPMEISMMNWDIGNSFPENGEPDKMLDYVQSKFNIKIIPINVTWEDVGEKTTAWAAAGTLPDVIGATSIVGGPNYYQWIKDGVVRALPDDLSAYPNVKHFVDNPDVAVYAVDGKNYFMPRQTYVDSAWQCMDVGILSRKDWREKLGLDIPKTPQDFIDMCVAFTKSDPDGNGVDDTFGYTVYSSWSLCNLVMSGFGNTDGAWIKRDDGSVVMPNMEKTSLPLLSFYRKLYAAGGFEPDFATDPYDEGMRKFAAGKVGILGRMVSPTEMNVVLHEWITVQKDKDFVQCVEVLPPPEVPGQKTMRYTEKAYWSESYINSKVDDAKMDRILQFYDYFYTEEGMRLVLFGFEGQDYKMDGKDVVMLTDMNKDTGNPKSARDIYPYAYGGMGNLVAWSEDYLQYVDPTVSKELRDRLAAERERRIAEWVPCPRDYRIQAIDIPERQEMSGINPMDGWISFITNTTNTSDEDLFSQISASWEANGYKKAKDAMTKKVAELGY